MMGLDGDDEAASRPVAPPPRPARRRGAGARSLGLFLALGLAAWFGYLGGAAMHDDAPLPAVAAEGLALILDLPGAAAGLADTAPGTVRLRALAAHLQRHPDVQVVGGNALRLALDERVAAPRALLRCRLSWAPGTPRQLRLQVTPVALPGLEWQTTFFAPEDGDDAELAARVARAIAALAVAPGSA